MDLTDLRERLSRIDTELLELVAERQRLSQHIARVKRETGRPTRDFGRERDVLLRAREAATRLGVSPLVAEQILRLLIRSSLTTQEQALVAAQGLGTGRRALIIGGAGKMGRWFADYLASQGFAVEVADPRRRSVSPARCCWNWRRESPRDWCSTSVRSRRRCARDSRRWSPRACAPLPSTRCSGRTPSCSPAGTCCTWT
jgi:chorismate mutase